MLDQNKRLPGYQIPVVAFSVFIVFFFSGIISHQWYRGALEEVSLSFARIARAAKDFSLQWRLRYSFVSLQKGCMVAGEAASIRMISLPRRPQAVCVSRQGCLRFYIVFTFVRVSSGRLFFVLFLWMRSVLNVVLELALSLFVTEGITGNLVRKGGTTNV